MSHLSSEGGGHTSMSDDLIERLRRPHRQIHRSTGRVVEKSSPAIQHEAADALAAKDTELSEVRAELERVKKTLILTPMAERVSELHHFMAALAEWGCTDPNEQAAAVTDFLNSLVGLREYLSDGLSTPPRPEGE